VFQTCGAAIFSQNNSTMKEESDDDPSAPLSLLPRDLIVRHGTTPEGKQRYRCRACPERGRTFLLEYTYAGQSPDVKQQIVEMAMNASGIRDTARVLHVSPTTVIKELKKRNLSSSR
jgi:transposase-like protein